MVAPEAALVTRTIGIAPEKMLMLPPKIHIWDTFPLHPPLHSGEALSSYLSRLMALNGITEPRRMFALCFPQLSSRITPDHLDLGMVPLGPLASLTGCTESRLIAATYAPLAERFGLNPLAAATLSFLGPGLTRSSQFCPACLVEGSWYRLIWRFTRIRGCLDHNYSLINRCRQCSSPFSLLDPVNQPGQCPRCRLDHRGVAGTVLTKEDRWATERYVHDLASMLTPMHEPTAQVQNTLRQVSMRLAARRQAAGLHAADIIPFLPGSLRSLHSLEDDVPASGAFDISIYMAYASFLGFTIPALFDLSTQVSATHIRQGRTHLVTTMTSILADLNDQLQGRLNHLQAIRESATDPVVQAIDAALTVLARRSSAPTWSNICAIAGLRWEAVRHHPGAHQRVDLAKAESRVRARYRGICALVIQVVAAILVLRAKRNTVSLTQVAQLLQYQPHELLYYPEIGRLIKEATMLHFLDDVPCSSCAVDEPSAPLPEGC